MIGMALLDGTDLRVSELCLGTNPFGWTTGEPEAFEVMDAYVAAGGNFLDTADVYSAWAEGNSGGEAEAVIGHWIDNRGRSDDLVIATKVGSMGGLGADNIRRCLDASLRRLNVEHLDLYYAHRDDPDTPLEQSLGAFDDLVQSGKVRYIGISNYSAARLGEILAISEREGFTRVVAMTPQYNLLERSYETTLAPVLAENGVPCIPYYGLAKGFLTGKYRVGQASPSNRGRLDGSAYVNERGVRVLGALEQISSERGASTAAVALAWLAAQPTVLAPIASARTVQQLADLLPMAGLRLTPDELALLDDVSGEVTTTDARE